MQAMRLIDLHPRWFGFDGQIHGLSFECPHCRTTRLAVAFHHKGHELQEDALIRAQSPTTGHIWTVTGDTPAFDEYEHKGFDHLSLSPSVDASHLGHWHGFVTDGGIT
jgi:hypothetical protein